MKTTTKQSRQDKIIQRKAERDSVVAELTWKCRQIEAAALVPNAGELAFRLADAAQTWRRFQEDIAEAQVEMACNPTHWLEWAEQYAQNAVEAEMCEAVLRSETPQTTIVELRARMTDDLLSDAHGGRSSSEFSNAMDAVRRRAYVSLLRSGYVFAKPSTK